MLNRAVVLLRLKQPFVDWVNSTDPDSENHLTLADANDEGTVYLVELEDHPEFEEWLRLNHESIFEEQLEGWYNDQESWPQDRSLAQFRKWFTVELHTVVHDTGESPLESE